MASKLRAIYTSAGDPANNTPAFQENEILTLVHKHDNGWLEVQTAAGVRGYVSPAWVEELPAEAPSGPTIPPPQPPAAAPASPEKAAFPAPASPTKAPSAPASPQKQTAAASPSSSPTKGPAPPTPTRTTPSASPTKSSAPSSPLKEPAAPETPSPVPEALPVPVDVAPANVGPTASPPQPPLSKTDVSSSSIGPSIPPPPVPSAASVESAVQEQDEPPPAIPPSPSASALAESEAGGKDDDEDEMEQSFGFGEDTPAAEPPSSAPAAASHSSDSGPSVPPPPPPTAEDAAAAAAPGAAGEQAESAGPPAAAPPAPPAHDEEGPKVPPPPPPVAVASDGDDEADAAPAAAAGLAGVPPKKPARDGPPPPKPRPKPKKGVPNPANRMSEYRESSSPSLALPDAGAGSSVSAPNSNRNSAASPAGSPVTPRSNISSIMAKLQQPASGESGSEDGDESNPSVPLPRGPTGGGQRISTHFSEQLAAKLNLGGPPMMPPGRKPPPHHLGAAAPPMSTSPAPTGQEEAPPVDEDAVEGEQQDASAKSPILPPGAAPPAGQPPAGQPPANGPNSRSGSASGRKPHRAAPPPPTVKPVRSAPAPPPGARKAAPRASPKRPGPPPPSARNKPGLVVQPSTGELGESTTDPVMSLTTDDIATASSSTDHRSDVMSLSMEGPLEKKQLLENGKEAKKRQWQAYYVVLAGPTLYFFKDEKEKKKGKKPLSFVQIEDKEVAHAHEYTKKKFSFVVGNDMDRVLLQAPDENVMASWIQVLTQACKPDVVPRRAQTMPATERQPAAATAAPDVKSPAANRHSISAFPEDDKGGDKQFGFVRRRLNKYLARRPEKEELKKKGIIEDPVFGGTIDYEVTRECQAHPELEAHKIPLVITKAIAKVDKNLTEQGIYRVSGNSSQIQRLVGKCNSDPASLDLESIEDVHAVTGLLKLYFRELAEPVFTEEHYAAFIAAGKMSDADAKEAELKRLIALLPESHQNTLRVLFQHLQRVAAQHEENKMQFNNLAIVFGPTLLRQGEPSLESIVMDAPYQSSVVEELMKRVDFYFP